MVFIESTTSTGIRNVIEVIGRFLSRQVLRGLGIMKVSLCVDSVNIWSRFLQIIVNLVAATPFLFSALQIDLAENSF